MRRERAVTIMDKELCKGHPGRIPRSMKECVADLRAYNLKGPCPYCNLMKDPSSIFGNATKAGESKDSLAPNTIVGAKKRTPMERLRDALEAD